MKPRNAYFLLLVAVSLLFFWAAIGTLLHYPIWSDAAYDKYCYAFVVPFLSLMVVFLEKDTIFAHVRYDLRAGALLLLLAIALRLVAHATRATFGVDNSLSIELLGLVVFWMGAFILCYGWSAFRAGTFPLLLLLLTVPIPDFLLDKVIVAVQHGSTEVCAFTFALARVPVLREGLTFSLANITIRVAKECSGIHSTMAILLLSLIAGHLFLTSIWKKALLVLLAIPIVCVTNGLRISILTLLAEYVNPSFMFGPLHRKGGVLFFALALLLLYMVLLLLKTKPPRSRLREASSQQSPS